MAMSSPQNPTAQPAPAITDLRPHRYLIRRRFIGPLPASVAHSKEAKESRAWYRALKSKLEAENATVTSTLGGASSAGGQSTSTPSTPALRLREDFRAKGGGSGGSGWIGSSFDIGAEFEDVIGTDAKPRKTEVESAAAHDSEPAPVSVRSGRPTSSKRSNTGTTTASFRTAQTQTAVLDKEQSPSWSREQLHNNAAASTSKMSAPELDTSISVQSSPAMLPDSGLLHGHDDVEGSSVRRLLEQGATQGNGVPSRLRSAFKGMRASEERATSPGKSGRSRRRTVQFPKGEEPIPATEPPADPLEVLARTGDQVEGTSAGVVEQSEPSMPASDVDDDEDQEEYGPDSVVLRDRLLVRVGRMRGQGFKGYDEVTAVSRGAPSNFYTKIADTRALG